MGFLNNILSDFIGSFIYDLITGGAVVTAFFGLWKRYRKQWGWPLLLIAFIGTIYLGISIVVLGNIWRNQIKAEETVKNITQSRVPVNIEKRIQDWALDAGYEVKKNENKNGTIFSLKLTSREHRPVVVSMKNDNKNFILVEVTLVLPEKLDPQSKKLEENTRAIIMRKINIALIQQGVYIAEEPSPYRANIFIDLSVDELNESTFWKTLHLIESTMVLVEQMVDLNFRLLDQKPVMSR